MFLSFSFFQEMLIGEQTPEEPGNCYQESIKTTRLTVAWLLAVAAGE